MLKTRVITALVGFIIAIVCITFGGVVFDALITLLALIGWREFTLLAKSRRVRMPLLWGYIYILAVMTSLSLGYYNIILAIGLAGVFCLYMMMTFGERYKLHNVGYSIFGVIYVLLGMGALLLIRQDSLYSLLPMPYERDNWGVVTIWLLLFTTWASDTFSYFAGCAFGKNKIVPTISPNKTLEGFIGGFIGAIATGIVYAFIVGTPMYMGAFFGIIIGVLAPLGDLFESKMKRICDVKDSGVLLPGHGGVLDRFDSLLFAAPAVLAYLTLL